MNLRNLFLVNTVVALIFGLVFVLSPRETAALYDLDLSEGGQLIGRLFGAALLGFAALTWFTKDAQPSDERQSILLALFIGDGVGFVVSLLAQFAGVANALGWTTVILYLLLALGFGYFRFIVSEG